MKKFPKLTPRLKLIASLVPNGSTVADIGTDHAYIPIFLANSGVATRAIAADKHVGPLKIAEENIRIYGCEDSVKVRQSDGLLEFAPGEVDIIIISGMGGILISEILESGREVAQEAKLLILQPMTAQRELREYLTENGYVITDERVTREREKFYYCICARSEKL